MSRDFSHEKYFYNECTAEERGQIFAKIFPIVTSVHPVLQDVLEKVVPFYKETESERDAITSLALIEEIAKHTGEDFLDQEVIVFAFMYDVFLHAKGDQQAKVRQLVAVTNLGLVDEEDRNWAARELDELLVDSNFLNHSRTRENGPSVLQEVGVEQN